MQIVFIMQSDFNEEQHGPYDPVDGFKFSATDTRQPFQSWLKLNIDKVPSTEDIRS